MPKAGPSEFRRRIPLFFIITNILCLSFIAGCAPNPIVKVPKPFPDIVKDYRSFKISIPTYARKTGIHVRGGDFFTILARGEITWEGGRAKTGPVGLVIFKIGDKGESYPFRSQVEFNSRKAEETGEILLLCGANLRSLAYSGSFDVDIIVWRKDDPIRISNFLEDLSQADPANEALRKYGNFFREQKQTILADFFRKQEQTLLAEETAKKGLGPQEKPKELSKEQQPGVRQDEEIFKTLRIPPIIVIATPKDGVNLESESTSLLGVVEHGTGIAEFEILVNNAVVKKRDQKLDPLKEKRIDFSERILLKEGRNEITIIAQDVDGKTAKKSVWVNRTKKKGKVWAVVIGINQYKKFPPLKYSVNDAREFYRYLVETNQVPRENIWLLLDQEATLESIRSVLGTQVRRKAGKDDMVIIYLAGHGTTERDSASLDGDGLEKYILPYNADPRDLYASALPMREVSQIFQRISSERLVFISDTCYSGAAGGRTVPILGTRAQLSGAFLDRLSQGKGRMILTASDSNEVSVEKDELGHGVFTYYLLEALRGKGDLDGDGLITLDEVYRYVSMKVPQATEQGQHPVRKGEMIGEIILGMVR